MSGIAEAVTYTVDHTADDGLAGSLRTQITNANGAAGNTVNFAAPGLNNSNVLLNSGTGAAAISANMTIDATAPTNLSVTFTPATAGAMFNVTAGNTLTLIGNNNIAAGNASNWLGNLSMAAGASLVFNQTQSSTYGYNFLGAGSVNYLVTAGQTLTLTGASTYTGSSMITTGTVLVAANNALPTTGGVNLGNGTALTINNSSLSTSGSILASAGTYSLTVENGATLTVNNPISGYSVLNVYYVTSNLILNNGGSLSNGIVMDDATFTINGGTFSGNIFGGNVNVNSTFTAPGTVQTNILNVNSGATFTPGSALTLEDVLNVNAGGTLLLTNNIQNFGFGGGNLNNAGTVTLTANATPTIQGNFTNSGTLNFIVTSPQQYNSLQVNGTTTINGGALQISLPSGTTTSINGGEVFNIINSTGLLTVNQLPTVSTQSLFIDFVPRASGNTFQLVAERASYESVNQIPALDGVATGLDALITDTDYNDVLSTIDQITDPNQYTQILEQLAPIGLNNVYVPTTGDASVLLRLETMRGSGISLAQGKTGYAAGDMLEDQGSYGPMIFGNSTKQSSRGGLSGYNAFTGGFGILADIPILQYYRFGIGASYAGSAVKQSNNTGSNTTIGSTQGYVYGSATYGPLFLDAVLSLGSNNYHGKRNITLLGQTATSAYTGFQYGAKFKAGFTIPCYQVELTPLGTLQYMSLNTSRYTEQGAGILNQEVSSMRTNTIRAGIGGRIADRSQEEDFFPEIHALYIVDIRNPNVLITSRFVDGGGSFVSTGVLPPKSGVTLGGSLTALVTNNFIVNGSYDLEAKTSFRSHSISFKFKYLF